MSRPFHFKKFSVVQQRSAHKVGTDGVLLGAWVDVAGVSRLLDVGTGTGVIALMLTQRSNANVVALEPHKPSCEEAQQNAAHSPWASRIQVQHTTLQAFANTNPQPVELVVSNPPYFVGSTKSGNLARDAARHTENLPFDVLLDCAYQLSSKRLALILPSTEANTVCEMAPAHGWHLTRVLHVQGAIGKPVERWAMEFSKQQGKLVAESLTIEDAPRVYSAAYKALTRDFYLKF